jgi:A/G-specific adenine glycosylase
LFCTPKNPACDDCIFKSGCFAFEHKMQDQLPVKVKSKPARKRYFYYIVIQKGKSLQMKKRAEKDIWFGLFDFQLIEKSKPVKIEKLLAESHLKSLVDRAKKVTVSENYKHILTHQTILSTFISIEVDSVYTSDDENLSFYSLKQIVNLPKPVLVSRFLNDRYLS